MPRSPSDKKMVKPIQIVRIDLAQGLKDDSSAPYRRHGLSTANVSCWLKAAVLGATPICPVNDPKLTLGEYALMVR
jgi:hypothetical protein